MSDTYSDYIDHYIRDSYDIPCQEDMPFFRRYSEQRRYETVARAVKRQGGRLILDAGSGPGNLSRMLTAPGRIVVGSDLGFDALQRGNRIGSATDRPIRYVQADSYRLPFADAVFDSVVSSEVTEHLDNPPAAFAEYYRVLKPGGACFISTPYRERIHYTRCIHCNEATPINAHLHTFDEHTLGTLMQNAGFTIAWADRFASRYAAVAGVPGLTGFLPYTVWRVMDRVFCGLAGRQSFILMKAVRGD